MRIDELFTQKDKVNLRSLRKFEEFGIGFLRICAKRNKELRSEQVH